MHGIIFSLKASFSARRKLQLKKKVSQNRTKLQQTTTNNNNNNNKRPFFLPKINKVFLRPILQNLKGRSVLDNFFFENDPLDELNQMPLSKKFYLFRKLVKNAKKWSKSNLPLSHSTAKFFPLKRVLKNSKLPEDVFLETLKIVRAQNSFFAITWSNFIRFA